MVRRPILAARGFQLKQQDKRCLRACLIIGAIGAVIIMILVGVCTALVVTNDDGPTPSSGTSSPEDRRKGFHCLSQWDGNHDGLESLVRDQLNDPGSLKTYETRIGRVAQENRHRIEMDLGATNLFGAMVRLTAYGWVDNATCKATLTSVE